MSQAQTENKWTKVIAAWEASGKSQKAFCAQKGISFWSLRYWRSKMKDAASDEGPNPPTPFVEVKKQIQKPSKGSGTFRVIHPNGLVIEFDGWADPRRVVEIIQALGTP
jgi:hypothetical protein